MWNELQAASKSLNETNDCAIKAVAVITGAAYEDVHKVFKSYGRKSRKPTLHKVTECVLAWFFIKTVNVTSQFKSKTIRTLARELPRTGTYLVWVRRHVLTIKDGKVCDWTADRLHRIKRIEKVI